MDSVRFGKYIEVNLSTDDVNQASEEVEDMCQKLLANPVIEQYSFEMASPDN